MNEIKNQVTRNKGGRPKKPVKQRAFIGVKCSLVEKIMLKQKAKAVGLSLSEYLRETGLNGQVVRRTKAYPKEILQFTGTSITWLQTSIKSLKSVTRWMN